MSAQPKPTYTTPEEYLHWERKAETRHEYYDGDVVAMAGASITHNLVTLNIASELHTLLKNRDCITLSSEMRLRVLECNRYYYPDVVVVCGKPEFEDDQVDSLLNPTCIIEVLSRSTEAKDRGEKLHCYQSVPSLLEYVLVSQHEPLIEVYTRYSEGWKQRSTNGMDSNLFLSSLELIVPLLDIYARVTFPSEESD